MVSQHRYKVSAVIPVSEERSAGPGNSAGNKFWTDFRQEFRLIAMNSRTDNPHINSPFLYLGDDDVNGAAAYLAGLMTHFGLDYEHRPSDTVLEDGILKRDWSVLVISDYPAENISAELMRALTGKVADGMGLLMIGGWESYQGQGGGYHGTALGEILPVIISAEDDRLNSSGPCLVASVRGSHPIVEGLPFESDAPGVGGFNRFEASDPAEVVLESRRYRAVSDRTPGTVQGTARSLPAGHHLELLSDPEPLLVCGTHGKGRTCAWASDVAPHWVGGLVDWGPERVEARGKNHAGDIEVGNLYAEFFSRMLRWTAGLI